MKKSGENSLQVVKDYSRSDFGVLCAECDASYVVAEASFEA